MSILTATRRLSTHLRSVATLSFIGSLLTLVIPAPAKALGSPPACQEYTGEAHIQCLHIYIEMQEKRIAQMEGALQGKSGSRGNIGQPLDALSTVPQGSQPPIILPSADSVYVYPSTAPGYAYAGYGYPGVPYTYGPYGAVLALGLGGQATTAGRFFPHDTFTDPDSSGLAFTDRDSTDLGFMEARDFIPALDLSALVLFRGLTASDHSAADTGNGTPDREAT